MALVVVLVVLQILYPNRWLALFDRQSRQADENALELWQRHAYAHPPAYAERYAFKEMGFRANVYAESRRRQHRAQVQAFEAFLWHETPGSTLVRQASERRTWRGGPKTASVASRGFVMVVRDSTAAQALHWVRRVRSLHGVDLPVEMYHWADARELSVLWQTRLAALPDVTLHDLSASQLFDDAFLDELGMMPAEDGTPIRGALALLATELVEVALVEATAAFIASPSLLFHHRAFVRTGTLLFAAHPTRARSTAHNDRFLAFLRRQLDGEAPSPALAGSSFWLHGAETRLSTGVMAFDKARPGVLSALLLNAWQQTGRARTHVWSRFPSRQRESIWLAFEMAAVAHYFETAPGALGVALAGEKHGGSSEARLCHALPLHGVSLPGAIWHPLWVDTHVASPALVDLTSADAWASDGRWEHHEGEWCMRAAMMTSLHTSPSLSLGVQRWAQKDGSDV